MSTITSQIQMNFSSIPGQKEIKEKLLRSVKEERVSHAQIFAG